jgi:NADH dehydrogenase [ubiquinone] 1 alpha subcomplex assembly factor 7
LMRDLLNGTKSVSGFHKSLNIYLIDINPELKKNQKDNLSQFEMPINWIQKISDLPERPTIFIANEFFDALPVHQYVKEKNHWSENVIAIKHDNNQLFFKRRPLVQDFSNHLNIEHPNSMDGAVLEESKEGIRWMQEIAEYIANNHGAALIIDYGYDIDPNIRKSSEYNSTLQAIKNHRYHPILEDIGVADLSAHVDFFLFKQIATTRNLQTTTLTQSEFLRNFGIDIRLQFLKKQNPGLTDLLDRQYHRLISEKQMGALFKVCIIEG